MKNARRFAAVSVLALALTSLASPAMAAKGSSTISGVLRVHQANGDYVPLVGVQVELDDPDSVTEKQAVTASDGSFSFEVEYAGTYRVSTSAYADFSGSDQLVTDSAGTAYPSIGAYRYLRVGSLAATLDGSLTVENNVVIARVSGLIKDQNANPLKVTVGNLGADSISQVAAEVTFEDSNTGKTYTVASDATGAYQADVPLATYFVSVGCSTTDAVECTYLGNTTSKADSTQLTVGIGGASEVSITANTLKLFTLSRIAVSYGKANNYFAGETISTTIATDLAEIATANVSYQWVKHALQNSSTVPTQEISGATSKDLIVPEGIGNAAVLLEVKYSQPGYQDLVLGRNGLSDPRSGLNAATNSGVLVSNTAPTIKKPAALAGGLKVGGQAFVKLPTVTGFESPVQKYVAWLVCTSNKSTFKTNSTGMPNPTCSYKSTLVPSVKFGVTKGLKGKYLVAIVLLQNSDQSYVTTLTNFVKITK